MKPLNTRVSLSARLAGRVQSFFAAFLITAVALPASAGIALPTDPLQSSGRVAPNILFILDDSGSMGWDYMPDSVPATSPRAIQRETYARNSIYYNPAINYKPWVDSTGALMTGGLDYKSAYSDDNHLSGSKDLSGDDQTFFVPMDVENLSEDYLRVSTNYYRYQILKNGKVYRSERMQNHPNDRGDDDAGCESSSSGWRWKRCTRVTPTGRGEAEERANFAAWYSYHRTRMKVAKAGAGNAFVDLGKDVRVGFRTIWGRTLSGNAITESKPILVDRNDGLFDDPNGPSGANNNRSVWYDRLYKTVASGQTPLHAALRRAGEYYKDSSQDGPYGPQKSDSQFVCRQNFTILTTDGYWNSRTKNVDYPGPQDNSDGPLITNPTGASYQYKPKPPYASPNESTLADMAMKYWKNDLRPDMDNLVPTSSANPAFWQHMVTFGISIGEQGTLDPSSDLPRIASGEIDWPTPGDNKIENIDDLWHASVNGRGKFLVAKKPDEFASGLRASLAAIVERTGSFSNVAASSTRLDTGTQLFQASFVSGVWTGDLKSYAVSDAGVASDADWSASAGIPVVEDRNIFTHNGTAGASFPTTEQQTQLGADIASYISGDRTKELNNGGAFRNRNHLLGDIVSSSPVYDARTKTLYVGANDGMLHAFDSENGEERFAYIPRSIDLPALKTLSDPGYAHRYFVDGPLALSRREQTPGKSILVGTLGKGGKGIFALDVSSPGSFAAGNVKWEHRDTTNNNMGLVLGKPIIAKLNNGDMGVIVSNGLNSSGDRAALLIYRLEDGELLAEIDTGVGTPADPNGLFGPTTRDLDGNGTVDLVFAGDLHGNLWKFDVSSVSASAWSNTSNRMAMFKAQDGAGNRQPITSAPAVARDPSTYDLWVFFGTGRFFTEGDVADKKVQSLYGLKIGDSEINRATELQKRQIVIAGYRDGVPVRGFEAPSELTGSRGWYIDLKTPPAPGTAEGERIVSDAQVVANVLITSSIMSSADPCLPGGKGFVNALDAFTGASLGASFFDLDGDGDFTDEVIGPDGLPIGSVDLGVGMPTLSTLIGKLLGVGGSTGTTEDVHINLPTTSGRVSWREIIRE